MKSVPRWICFAVGRRFTATRECGSRSSFSRRALTRVITASARWSSPRGDLTLARDLDPLPAFGVEGPLDRLEGGMGQGVGLETQPGLRLVGGELGQGRQGHP